MCEADKIVNGELVCGLENQPKQQAVTREEYLVANNYGKEELFFQLLTERDQLLKEISELDRDVVQQENIKLARERDEALQKYKFVSDCLDEERLWKEAYREALIRECEKKQCWSQMEGYHKQKRIDAENESDNIAKRIFEQGK